MKARLTFVAAIAGCLLLTSVATHAAVWNYSVGMSPSQSSASAIPGVPTPPDLPSLFGGGSGLVAFDDATLGFTWDLIFNSLTAAPFVAHIHFGAPTVSGGVAIGLGPALPVPPLGPTNGAYSGATVLSPVGDAALIAVLTAPPPVGSPIDLYANVHTPLFPAGEIRGQLILSSVVPVPAAVWLLLSSLGALLFKSRRRVA